MSCYVVDKKVIDLMVSWIMNHNIDYRAENYHYEGYMGILFDVNEMSNAIGQSLLDANYDSVNYRYDENKKAPTYEYSEDALQESLKNGTYQADVYSAIQEYNYQACETENYFESELYHSLQDAKESMLVGLLRQQCPKADGWGFYD